MRNWRSWIKKDQVRIRKEDFSKQNLFFLLHFSLQNRVFRSISSIFKILNNFFYNSHISSVEKSRLTCHKAFFADTLQFFKEEKKKEKKETEKFVDRESENVR